MIHYYGHRTDSTKHTQDNRVFCFLDDKLKEQLDKYVNDYRTKRSQVLRTALIKYLKGNGYDPDKKQVSTY